MSSDGSNIRRLTSLEGGAWNPAWSPDGSKIAFVNGSGIHVMNADGSGITRLETSGTVSVARLAWSPDGTKIAFEASPSLFAAPSIYVFHLDGSGVRRLTYDPSGDYWPTWTR